MVVVHDRPERRGVRRQLVLRDDDAVGVGRRAIAQAGEVEGAVRPVGEQGTECGPQQRAFPQRVVAVAAFVLEVDPHAGDGFGVRSVRRGDRRQRLGVAVVLHAEGVQQVRRLLEQHRAGDHMPDTPAGDVAERHLELAERIDREGDRRIGAELLEAQAAVVDVVGEVGLVLLERDRRAAMRDGVLRHRRRRDELVGVVRVRQVVELLRDVALPADEDLVLVTRSQPARLVLDHAGRVAGR